MWCYLVTVNDISLWWSGFIACSPCLASPMLWLLGQVSLLSWNRSQRPGWLSGVWPVLPKWFQKLECSSFTIHVKHLTYTPKKIVFHLLSGLLASFSVTGRQELIDCSSAVPSSSYIRNEKGPFENFRMGKREGEHSTMKIYRCVFRWNLVLLL